MLNHFHGNIKDPKVIDVVNKNFDLIKTIVLENFKNKEKELMHILNNIHYSLKIFYNIEHVEKDISKTILGGNKQLIKYIKNWILQK